MMNTASFLMKTALVATASLIVLSIPAEARNGRYDHRHPHAKKHHFRRPFAKPRPPYMSTEMRVQNELARLGYYRGRVDGQIGAQSRAAIRAYQIDRRLPVTGRIDHRLLRSLRLV